MHIQPFHGPLQHVEGPLLQLCKAKQKLVLSLSFALRPAHDSWNICCSGVH